MSARPCSRRSLSTFQGLDSCLHPHQRWQDARGQCAELLGLGPRTFYVMDRGYVDFATLFQLYQASAFFVNRAKSNMNAMRVFSAKVDRTSGIICDQSNALNGRYIAKDYRTPAPYPVQRSRNPTDFGIPDKQHKLPALDHRRFVQKPLEGGIVLKMGQTAPEHQKGSGQQRGRGQDANLMRRVHLHSHRHC